MCNNPSHKSFLASSYNPLKATPTTTLNNPIPHIGSLELVETLTKGISHKVKLGRDRISKSEYVVKLYKSLGVLSHPTHDVDQQAIIHSALSRENPNILDLLHYFPNVEYINKNGKPKQVHAFVMQLVGGTTLFDYLKTTSPLPEKTALFYFDHLISGIEYIHQNDILHNNIRPESLVISKDFLLKIADFGYARPLSANSQDQPRLPAATDYLAPELLQREGKWDSRSDLFSCGVVLFTMVTGHPPFSQASAQDPYYKLILKKEFGTFWKQHEREGRKFSDSFKDLVNRMLRFDPIERPSIEEIRVHKWFMGPRTSVDELKIEAIKNQMFERKKEKVSEKGRADTNVSPTGAKTCQKPQGFYAMQGVRVIKK